MQKIIIPLLLILILLVSCSTTGITKCTDACIKNAKDKNVSLDAEKCQYKCEQTRLHEGRASLEELTKTFQE